MKTNFVVQTDSFEGPLHTLLAMIEKRKLYINDISLAKVTNDYIRHIADHQETIGNKIEFVSIASTLVLAKSKSLLPDEVTSEEEDEISELEDRLKAYRIIKECSERLCHMFATVGMYPPIDSPQSDITHEVFAPGGTLTQEMLQEKADRSITSLPKESLPTASIENNVSLQEEMRRLQERCRASGTITFSAAVRSNDKRDQVVLFVAVLELVKGGSVEARQHGVFADITIHHQQ